MVIAGGEYAGDYPAGVDPHAPRRRPRPRPPTSEGGPPAAPPEPQPGPGRNPFALVVWAALALVAGVIAVAFATGTADELPWGAIIGVLAVLAFAYVAGRRRGRIAAGEDEVP